LALSRQLSGIEEATIQHIFGVISIQMAVIPSESSGRQRLGSSQGVLLNTYYHRNSQSVARSELTFLAC
jgi:hypothetical protein